jgi:hypothetical protein
MLKTVSLAAALLLAGQSALVAQPSIEWLEPFVGVWATVDTYYPVSGEPTVEGATRTCARIMQEAYLQCETIAQRPGGASRTYRFLSLWSNVPHKLVQSMVPNGDRRRWTFTNVAVIGDDEPMADHWSELIAGRPVAILGLPNGADVSGRVPVCRLSNLYRRGRTVGGEI